MIMKNILLRYEVIFGQAINFNKLYIIFSNTLKMNKNLICEIIEAGKVFVPGKYLGLRVTVGRKKLICLFLN